MDKMISQKTEKMWQMPRIETVYSSKSMEINKFCKENGWKILCYFSEGYIEIYSTFDIWRVCAINVPFQLKLYHKNMENELDDTSKFIGFHKQKTKVPFEDIIEILHYIKEHDIYIFQTKRTMNGLIRMQKQGSASAKYKKNGMATKKKDYEDKEICSEEKRKEKKARLRNRRFQDKEMWKCVKECTTELFLAG